MTTLIPVKATYGASHLPSGEFLRAQIALSVPGARLMEVRIYIDGLKEQEFNGVESPQSYKAEVNWSGLGSMAPAVALQYAYLIEVAARTAEMIGQEPHGTAPGVTLDERVENFLRSFFNIDLTRI